MKLHRKPADDREFLQISRVRAALLRVWGPADSWDSPLAGTKYDPVHQAERQHESLERRRQRWEERKQHWDARLHGPLPGDLPPRPEHPDD
jgi:hypothetical protein